MNDHILYTYERVDGDTVCHAYGPTTAPDAQAAGERLQKAAEEAQQAPLGFMVLPLETLPS